MQFLVPLRMNAHDSNCFYAIISLALNLMFLWLKILVVNWELKSLSPSEICECTETMTVIKSPIKQWSKQINTWSLYVKR